MFPLKLIVVKPSSPSVAMSGSTATSGREVPLSLATSPQLSTTTPSSDNENPSADTLPRPPSPIRPDIAPVLIPIQLDTATLSSSSSSTIVAMSGSAAAAGDPMVLDTDSEGDVDVNNPVDQALHKFEQLPELVRKKVWALNLPGPRLVEVIFIDKEKEWYTNAPIIVNLSVCRESRVEALRTHPLSFACYAAKAMIPFNFATDTLFLGTKMRDTQAFFKKHRIGQDLARVQFLMVDARLDWARRSQYDRGKGNLFGISQLVFSSVKEHTVLYSGDPLPHWAERHWFPRIDTKRFMKTDVEKTVARFKELWPLAPGRIQLSADEAEWHRYGGISPLEKREPAIRVWRIPKIYSFGVAQEVMESFGFDRSEEHAWGEILMDRVIEDIFT